MIKPWIVIVLEPEEEFLFFDDYMECVDFVKSHESLKCLIAVAIINTYNVLLAGERV